MKCSLFYATDVAFISKTNHRIQACRRNNGTIPAVDPIVSFMAGNLNAFLSTSVSRIILH
jgi:hypothetical protein